MADLGFRGILKSASVVGIGMIFSKAVSLVAETVIARELTTTEFGAAIFAYTVLLTAGSIALIGIPEGFTYFISIFDERGEDGSALRTVAAGVAILAVVLGLGVALLYSVPPSVVGVVGISQQQWRWFTLLGPLVVAYPISRLSFGIMRGYDLTTPKVLSDDVLNKIIAFLALTVVLWQGTSEFAFLVFYLGQYLLSGLFSGGYVLCLLHVKMKSATLRTGLRTEALQLVSYSWPLALKNATRRILGSTDIVLVGTLLASSSAVGYYRVAYVISQLGLIPLLAVLYLYTPRFAREYDNGNHLQMSELYSNVTKWSTFLALPILFPTLYYSSDIIRILFGGEYTPGAVVLTILSVEIIFRSGMGAAAATLQAIGQTRIDFATTALTTVANLGISYLLVLEFGIIGAAIGTAISLLIMNAVQVFLVYRLTSLQPFSKSYVLFVLVIGIATIPLFGAVSALFGTYRITALRVPVGLFAFTIGLLWLEIGFAWFGGYLSQSEKNSVRELAYRYRP